MEEGKGFLSPDKLSYSKAEREAETGGLDPRHLLLIFHGFNLREEKELMTGSPRTGRGGLEQARGKSQLNSKSHRPKKMQNDSPEVKLQVGMFGILQQIS